ncbi:hypothetical protein COHA_006469 [Chlorella ohadii]|uniref:Small ribosomal subunit protein mS33 n=1 Tax=Chlorella ohadii TaxID=2649997 RepID=A0AAD5H488_9CHLO|nr:hypothetical protein COHA_006469 [Chlorella ohadii]
MALRRSFCSMSSVLNGLQRLALLEAPCAAQQLGTASTLSSLRCLAPAVSQTARSSPAAAAGGCRQYAAAAAPTPAAAAAAEAPAAAEDESLEQIRSRIFGTHIGNGLRSGRKVLRKALVGERLMAWYPPDPIKHDPLMLSVKAENAKLKLDRLRRRGKAPPKKGAGKRAGKKK